MKTLDLPTPHPNSHPPLPYSAPVGHFTRSRVSNGRSVLDSWHSFPSPRDRDGKESNGHRERLAPHQFVSFPQLPLGPGNASLPPLSSGRNGDSAESTPF